MSYSRHASHAAAGGQGWYDASATRLKATIDNMFEKTADFKLNSDQRLVGVISPHAGISYSGPTAAHVYLALRNCLYSTSGKAVQRIFLLGPSHHKGFDGIECSAAHQYETPFGSIAVDTKVVADVKKAMIGAHLPVAVTSQFTDEEEHSIEMQMPFISHVLHFPVNGSAPAKDHVKIVPFIVGWADRAMEESIGAVFSSYARDPKNIFVLSSDFCHWGSRFQYTYHYEKSKFNDIGDAIIAMDQEGMEWLEKRDMDGWYEYLARTKNTICGRRPISIGMSALSGSATVRFLHYSQSNRCAGHHDSSVSYAAAVITE